MADKQVRELIGLLKDMRDEKQAPLPGILAKLGDMKSRFVSIQKRWQVRTATDGFYFYRAAKKCALVLDQIMAITKDLPAKPGGTNAYFRIKVAKDTMAVLYMMEEILELVDVDVKTLGKIPDPSIRLIRDQAKKLRRMAISHDVNEPITVHKEMLRKAAEKDLLVPLYTSLMKNLGFKLNVKPEIKNA